MRPNFLGLRLPPFVVRVDEIARFLINKSHKGARGISANVNREKNGRKNEKHSKTSDSRQRKLEYSNRKIIS